MKKLLTLIIPIVIISCNKLTDKANTCSNLSSTQTVFSVERISKEDYIQAYNTSADYNTYPQQVDTIALQDVLNCVFQDAKGRIAQLDSIERSSIAVSATEEDLYCIDNLRYYPDLQLLGFMVPLDYDNYTMWWYDSTTGMRTFETRFVPTAVNTNGIYVCQALADCDMMLELHFFKKLGNIIYNSQTYLNVDYNGEYLLFSSDEEQYEHIFWHKNNILYICSINYRRDSVEYLKISLGCDN